jgi:hypothetical protein
VKGFGPPSTQSIEEPCSARAPLRLAQDLIIIKCETADVMANGSLAKCDPPRRRLIGDPPVDCAIRCQPPPALTFDVFPRAGSQGGDLAPRILRAIQSMKDGERGLANQRRETGATLCLGVA